MRLIVRIALAFGMTLSVSTLVAQQLERAVDGRALDLAITYNAQHGATTGGNGFWLQGGSVEMNDTFYRRLGIAFNESTRKVQKRHEKSLKRHT